MKSNSKYLILSLLFVVLIALGAWVEIPLGPVPFILSDYFILLAGLLLGARYAALSVGIYLLLGACGLPVYAGGAAGFSHLIGPSGGYLIGFFLASLVVGSISHQGVPNLVKDGLATFSGQCCFFLIGLTWLYYATPMDVATTLEKGLFPFWWPIAFKWSAAVLVSYLFRRLGGRRWLDSLS